MNTSTHTPAVHVLPGFVAFLALSALSAFADSADSPLVDAANAAAEATVESTAFQKATDAAATVGQVVSAFPNALLTHVLNDMANDMDASAPSSSPDGQAATAHASLSPADEPSATEKVHFRQIRWGMSPDEVRAAEAPLSPLRETPSALVYATTTLDRPSLLSYAFRNGRLAAARLQFSLPANKHVPALSPDAARTGFAWLHSQIQARYGFPYTQKHDKLPRDTTELSGQARKSREEAQIHAATLAAARQRLAERTAQLKKKYHGWPEATARIDQELSSERRYVANLEARVAELQAAERSAQSAITQSTISDKLAPLHARDTAIWNRRHFQSSPHTVTLSADYTATPARLEIRYKSNLPIGPASSTEL